MRIGYKCLARYRESPSGRHRAFHVMDKLREEGYNASFYSSRKEFDCLVFVKAFKQEDIEIAKKFKGLKIFDVCDNFYVESEYSTKDDVERCREMTRLCDKITVASNHLAKYAREYNKDVVKIPDMLADVEDKPLIIGWHGIASNYKLLYRTLKNTLEELGKEKKIVLKLITNYTKSKKEFEGKEIKNITTVMKEWNLATLHEDLKECDICIAPLDMNEWTKAKSSNKIVIPLRLGKTILCSRTSEYEEIQKDYPDDVVICDTEEDWKNKIVGFINKRKKREMYLDQDNIYLLWRGVLGIKGNVRKIPMPLVSVVTAAYNAEKTLEKTIESVINQTYFNWEYIIVDDASTDQTFSIMMRFKSEYPDKIKVLRNNTNLKQGKSRNKAIKASKGKYVTNIDSDDLMEKDRLFEQVKFLEGNTDVDICYGGHTTISIDGKITSAYIPPLEWDENKMLNKQNLINHNTTMFRGKILYDENWEYAEDYSTWLRTLKIGGKIRPLNKNLTYYRVYPESKWHSHIKECEKERDDIIAYWKKFDMNKPMVSIIMPTYNRPEFLRKSIGSVLGQSYPNFELIVVNDGGVDVKSVISEYRDKRIKYVSKGNGGLSSALNEGVRKATGKYIAYLDDDDLWGSNHLEVTVEELERGEVDAVYTICNRITPAGDVIAVYNDRFNSEILTIERNFITTCSIVHKAGLITKMGMFDESLATHMDWDMWKKFVKNGVNFKHLTIQTCYYVEHGNNMLGSNVDSNDRDRTIVRRR